MAHVPPLIPPLPMSSTLPFDTSPITLSMAEPKDADSPSRSSSRVKRLSNSMEKTVNKLGRSISGKATPPSPTKPGAPSSPRHMRMFSINRKGKGKERADSNTDDMLSPPSSASTPSASRPSSPMKIPHSSPPDDSDSPFITPPSPTLAPSRPSMGSFRGGGSMRAGTQTLIQALQALPWTDPDNEDDVMPHNLTQIDSGSEDEGEGKTGQADRLASSIHTIYRPLARSHRLSAPGPRRKALPQYSPVNEEEAESEATLGSSEENEAEDFEESTPRPQYAERPNPLHERLQQQSDSMTIPPSVMRSGSMATVRIQRRVRLAEKLKEVFELDGIEEVWAVLQGYMYLTNSYLCFFAHMPAREDQVLKSGSLNKKTQRTKRWIKHWFVLKNDALSWYQSSSDPYFPHGIVDLRYAISCEAAGDKEFRVRTNQKTVVLSAASVPSREEWVKAIRKVIFKAQNMGDSVKIAIPYSTILDVDKSTAMDFSETIEVKVFDKEEHFSVDSYFFAYFHDLPSALDQIRDAVRAHRVLPEQSSPQMVMDTTVARPLATGSIDRVQSLPNAEPPKSASSFSISSFLRPFHETMSLNRPSASNLSPTPESEGFTHISRRPNSSSFVPMTSSPVSEFGEPRYAQGDSPDTLTPATSNVHEHTYPPSTSLCRVDPDHPSLTSESSGSSWSVGVPSWLRGTRKVFGGSTESAPPVTSPSRVREVYSSTASAPPSSRTSGFGDLAFSVLESPDVTIDPEATEKFRNVFAYDEKETLLGYFPGYIFRLLPMTLPIRDILATEKSKATRFGHHGLIVIVKGHEELFFEFGAEDKRDAFVALLERQMEDTRRRLVAGDTSVTQGRRDALILEEFEAKSSSADHDPSPAADNMTDSLPALMFTSASSTFLTFKPKKTLHFTFLTIGSRGDVQPYIALAKGLVADGHRVRIATHGEFKEWIEAYGIEFGYVGGDPAELMRICIENGTFTVSFLKEGLQKFRGWLDDLLKNSWLACQGTDVLIESPSAMGGYHIAEALGIPYFRAFTMTWTRTRAYPHAFAVPERKMGGGYNYMTYVMFDQVFWRAISGQINRWRRNILHLGSTSLDKMEPHKIPFLYNFSPHVVPPPLDWPEWIRVTGYWFLDDADVSAKKWSPPADLVEFINSAHAEGKKVVYIGFGSIVVSDPKTMTRCVVDAVLRSGVRAILSKGWSDRLQAKAADASEPEEPLPKEIYPIPSIPHDWLFQRIDAACHHGGAGTTGASLRAGIPTIIRPFFGDQFFWADRVEALGVGTGVRKLTVDTLTEALILATTDIKQIDRARLIGEQMKGEDGVATAIESIYRDMDYARSLIKRVVVDSDDDLEDEIEHSTIRDRPNLTAEPQSGYSSSGSVAGGAPSEDWSVISEQDGRRLSISSQHSALGEGRSVDHSKRNSLAAAVMSVLPSPRRRTVSATANESRA
ncbi:hypothetical protein B0H10DRAFT_1996784 [Mycena sp. CBHHK59/15]|nr:hypothetical protein B0H10DRAFT_1996784 [Mycena sp. CBHHK59/15]